MKKVGLLIATFAILGAATVHAQMNVGTTAAPVSSAMLQVTSTNKGFLPPVMTSAQMNAIASPATGLMVYCTDCSPAGFWGYNGTAWASVGSANASSSVAANCAASGFYGGGLIQNTALTTTAGAGDTLKISVTNNTFGTATITPATSDVVLSGTGSAGLSVGSVSPTGATAIAAGVTQVFSYILAGTPTTLGTVTAVWAKQGLTCTQATATTLGSATFAANISQFVTSVNDVSSPPAIAGSLPTGTTQTMAYTGGRGTYSAYTSPDIAIPAAYSGNSGGQTGWTYGYSYVAGTFAASGSITVTLITKLNGTVTAWPALQVTSKGTVNQNISTVPWVINGTTTAYNAYLSEGSDAILASLTNSTSITNYNAASVNDYIQVTQAEYDNLTTTVVGITNFGMKIGDRALAPGTTAQSNNMVSNNIPTTAIPFAFSSKLNLNACSIQLTKQPKTVGALTEAAWSSAASLTISGPVGTYYFVIKRPNIYMPANTNIAVHGFNNGWGSNSGGTGGDGVTSSDVSSPAGGGSCTLVNSTVSSVPPAGTWPVTYYLNYDIKWTTTKQW